MKIIIAPEKETKKYLKPSAKIINRFFQNKPINQNAFINLHFVSPQKIKVLNCKYRQLDKATSVLSFPLFENIGQIPKKGPVILGDIFISQGKDTLDKQTLADLIEHSLEHLIGKHH
ncbi:MAG TPA: rRNA maturation RNase YbeY [Patescibacteria group bacterium]|nr:rRNA maturation RNase YbeY [Patescibacteria group bacterium]